MIIEIMLIILAIISVIVNTIVSVIIIKDTLNSNREGKITGKKLQEYINQLQKEPLIPIDTNVTTSANNQTSITTINPYSAHPNDKLHYAYATNQAQNQTAPAPNTEISNKNP